MGWSEHNLQAAPLYHESEIYWKPFVLRKIKIILKTNFCSLLFVDFFSFYFIFYRLTKICVSIVKMCINYSANNFSVPALLKDSLCQFQAVDLNWGAGRPSDNAGPPGLPASSGLGSGGSGHASLYQR
jgi:hypothetical protein